MWEIYSNGEIPFTGMTKTPRWLYFWGLSEKFGIRESRKSCKIGNLILWEDQDFRLLLIIPGFLRVFAKSEIPRFSKWQLMTRAKKTFALWTDNLATSLRHDTLPSSNREGLRRIPVIYERLTLESNRAYAKTVNSIIICSTMLETNE